MSAGPERRTEGPPAQLSRGAFAVSLLILLAIFALLNPIWQQHAMAAWDQNIGWSYVPIPLLVLLFLVLERKLSGPAFLLETLKLTFVKFVVTFLAANAIWAVWGTPGTGLPDDAPVPGKAGASSFQPRAAPAPTPLGNRDLGTLEGVVRDAQGRTVAGALVWVSSGLEELVFAPPDEEFVLEQRSTGIEPGLSIVQTWQSLRLRSADDGLHTVVLRDERGRRLANLPVLAGGNRELMFARARGPLELRCSVHGAAEAPTVLVVSGTPFHARTDDLGGFHMEGVPRESVVLSAIGPKGGRGQLRVTPPPVGGAPVQLLLGAAPIH